MEGAPKRPSFTDPGEVFFSSAATSRKIGAELDAGRVRRIARGLYSRNLEEALEAVTRRNWSTIAGGLFEGAVIVDRTAFEAAPAEDGSVFLDAGSRLSSDRSTRLPGLTLSVRAGPGPVEGDDPFMGTLHLSSRPRAYLDNLRPTRATKRRVRRTLSRPEIEDSLERLLATQGESALNALRDDARRVAPALGALQELEELDDLIGALLGTREADLRSESAKARRAGIPYDPGRAELFGLLHAELLGAAQPIRPGRNDGGSVFAFFEAYFSNFIEGTEFLLAEAEEIIFEGRIPPTRPKDAHDILGTFQVVNDASSRAQSPRSAGEFISSLQNTHTLLLDGRPEARPGRFKEKPNRAGSTTFVAPELVRGTLERGFEFMRALPAGFPRAVFVTFLVSEVHPFDDGNGRVARIAINGELTAAGEQRVIIPTVYRNNYLQALRALSRSKNPKPLVRVIDFAQRYSAAVPWMSVDEASSVLERTNAFMDATEADDAGVRLQMPSSALEGESPPAARGRDGVEK